MIVTPSIDTRDENFEEAELVLNGLDSFDFPDLSTFWIIDSRTSGQATPMTYYLEETGKQYVVIAAGGHARIGTTTGDYESPSRCPTDGSFSARSCNISQRTR